LVYVFTWNSPPTDPTSARTEVAPLDSARTTPIDVIAVLKVICASPSPSRSYRARHRARRLRLRDEARRDVGRAGRLRAPADALAHRQAEGDASLRGLVERVAEARAAALHGDAVVRDDDRADGRARRPVPVPIRRAAAAVAELPPAGRRQ